ncbi:MAG: hypothetical protein ACFHX7_11775 [Pseudomonadota bacterium]
MNRDVYVICVGMHRFTKEYGPLRDMYFTAGTGIGHLLNSEHLTFWHRLIRFAHARSINLAHLHPGIFKLIELINLIPASCSSREDDSKVLLPIMPVSCLIVHR